jgi:hypothetical protein
MLQTTETKNLSQASEISTDVNFTSGQHFLELVSKESLAAQIGQSVLMLKSSDSVKDIKAKMSKAVTNHPEHTEEILLCALTAIAVQSEDKDELLESLMMAFSLADKNTKH